MGTLNKMQCPVNICASSDNDHCPSISGRSSVRSGLANQRSLKIGMSRITIYLIDSEATLNLGTVTPTEFVLFALLTGAL